jgi:hypothetical protein
MQSQQRWKLKMAEMGFQEDTPLGELEHGPRMKSGLEY